jgi:hypothetical protein
MHGQSTPTDKYLLPVTHSSFTSTRIDPTNRREQFLVGERPGDLRFPFKSLVDPFQHVSGSNPFPVLFQECRVAQQL